MVNAMKILAVAAGAGVVAIAPALVLQPAPESDRQLRQRLSWALAQARNAAAAQATATSHLQAVYDAVHARIVADSIADLTPPPAPEPEPAELRPDSVLVLDNTVSVGDSVQMDLVIWWTIPQEPEAGSRPFVCFSGDDAGFREITFPGGYPGTVEWELLEDGHAFVGECYTAEVVPDAGQSA